MPLLNSYTTAPKKKESQFMRFFIPALLAILIHLSFFGFKKVDPPDVVDVAKPKQVMLLPQDSVVPDEVNLLAWLNILDSSYVIQPNRKYGFSRTFKPVEVEDIPLTLKDMMLDNEQDVSSFLPVPWRDQHARIRQMWKYEIEGIEPLDPRQFKPNLKYPLWLSEKNKVIPQMFEDTTELKNEIEKNPPPHNETVLQVTSFDSKLFPKVQISYSCGSKKLDMAALRTFTVKSKNMDNSSEDGRDSYYITVKWYSKEAN
jgi:hypothetical protein